MPAKYAKYAKIKEEKFRLFRVFRGQNFLRNFISIFISFLLILTFVTFQKIRAQETSPFAQNLHQWGAVSLFNGLPSDSVRAITQDKEGLMWFGTDNGLAKYDGRRVQAVSLAGVKSDKIKTLRVSATGTLWIGTESGATRFYDGAFYPIQETEDYPIVAITEDSSGKLILATESGRLFECKENEDKSLNVKMNFPDSLEKITSSLQVTSLAVDADKYILGTLGRSLVTIEDGEASEIYSRPRPFFVNALVRDRVGNIWFGTDAKRSGSGLYLAKDLTRPVNIGSEIGAVSSFAINEENEIWIGTTERGAYLFKQEKEIAHYTFENSAGGLRSNRIYTVFIDREGVIWFGTDRGISRFDPESFFNEVLAENSNSNFIRTLFQSKDGRIFGGTNRGLFIKDNGDWEMVPKFERDVVYAISENTSGEILIGTSEGLFKLNGEELIDDEVRGIEKFQGKTYASVLGNGVRRILEDGESERVFSNNSLITLRSSDNKLWIGTAEDGVFSFDGKTVVAETSLAELKGTTIRQIAGNIDQGLWFATEKGLYVVQDGILTKVVPDMVARDVVIDKDGSIWCGTVGFGLLHIKFDKEFGWIVSNLGVEQGLPSQQIFTVLLLENRLLIGSNRGIADYVPSQDPPLILPTRIISQRLHQPAELIEGINLDYPQNSLTVEVAALSNRTFPEQFQYAFLIKDSKGEIIDKRISRDSRFLMDNLKPDKYSVEIRAFDKDLRVSDTLKFQFSIASAPFPWTSTALAVLLAIASIALIWAFIERGRIQNANRKLAAARLDLANEAERERRRIARDLHDQTLADLRNLMLMSDKLPEAENGDMKMSFRDEVESVSDEIRRICEDLSPSVLENVGFSASLEFLLSHTFTQIDKDFDYKFICREDLEERLDLLPYEQMQIYRIAQEVLNNIAKHSGADYIEMKVTTSEDDGFTLRIKNNGEQFDAENAKRGRGISNIKARANLVKSTVSWEKRDLGGMTFTLRKKPLNGDK